MFIPKLVLLHRDLLHRSMKISARYVGQCDIVGNLQKEEGDSNQIGFEED